MLARVSSFVVWALVAASAVFWGTQLFARPAQVPARAVQLQAGASQDFSRVLGAAAVNTATPVPAESRFKLLGVVAPQAAQGSEAGVALITVDGVPRAVRVGAIVDGDWKLVSVEKRAATIGRDGAVTARLELPEILGALSVAPSPQVQAQAQARMAGEAMAPPALPTPQQFTRPEAENRPPVGSPTM